MDFRELLIECVSVLTLNKMRTGLAVLGVIIGIGSVIALVSLGQASQKAVETQIQSLGSNLLTISPGSQSAGGVRSAPGGVTTLVLSDADAITTSLPDLVAQVSPEHSARAQITAGKNNTNTQVIGTTPKYADIHKISLASGVFISERDVAGMSKVAVLGAQTATDLFGETANPIGQSIRINGQMLTVVGITASKGGTGFNNPDDAVYVPLSTAMKQLSGADSLTSIAVEAKNKDTMDQARDAIGYLLLARHKLTDPTQADFSIFSQNDILSTASQVTGTFTTLLGGIAAISLLVGGIGIMNIMLVTVTERTREIGLRKALGAKRKVIIAQFLLEAILLTVVGGCIGVAVGIGISFALATILSMPFSISIPSILLAVGVSGIIGVVFGWYPARQAAQLQPIEALRYE